MRAIMVHLLTTLSRNHDHLPDASERLFGSAHCLFSGITEKKASFFFYQMKKMRRLLRKRSQEHHFTSV